MKKISLFRILKHDYMFLGCFIFVLITGIISVYTILNDAIYTFSVIPLVFLVLGVVRFLLVSMHFKNGEKTSGTVVSIWFMKDRGRVTYVYEVEGMMYKKGNAIMKTKETKCLNIGKSVDVIYNKDNPKKAMIESLYTK